MAALIAVALPEISDPNPGLKVLGKVLSGFEGEIMPDVAGRLAIAASRHAMPASRNNLQLKA